MIKSQTNLKVISAGINEALGLFGFSETLQRYKTSLTVMNSLLLSQIPNWLIGISVTVIL